MATRLDFSDSAIKPALNDVRGGTHQWALLTHQGSSTTMKVEETGSGKLHNAILIMQ
jgi:hypothetical protein